MRVGFFVNQFPSSSLTFVTNQVTGLIDRGFDVCIVGQRPKQQSLVHDEVTQYKLLERTHYWPPGGYRGVVEAARLHTRQALRKYVSPRTAHAGTFAFSLGSVQAVNVRAAVRQVRHGGIGAASRLLRKSATLASIPPFDVIVSHFGPVGLEVQQLRDLNILKAPMMTVFHGYDVSRWVERRGNDVYRPLFDRCEVLAPVSQYWADRLEQMGCPKSRIHVHRMGVDCTRIAFQARVNPISSPVQITSVARFTEKKGLEYALRALARLDAERKSAPQSQTTAAFHYNLVGDGPLRPELTALIRELGLQERVTLHGWQTQAQVISLLDNTHIFLLPSVTAADGDQEGIPVALMEAVAAGIPVVSTEHTGIPELVRHGGGKLLVKERDSEALAAAISTLLNNPDSWPLIGREGRQIVETHFNQSLLNDELANMLTRLGNARA